MNWTSPRSVLESANERWRGQFLTDYPSLGLYRILFVAFFVLRGPPRYGWIAQVPSLFFVPPPLSVATFLEGARGPWLSALDIAIDGLLLVVLVGFRTKVATALLLAAFFIGNNFLYSIGNIAHLILVECLLLMMIGLDWGTSFSLDAHLRARKAPGLGKERSSALEAPSLRLYAVMIAFGFLTAGIPKAENWLDLDVTRSGALAWLYGGYHTLRNRHLLVPFALSVPSPLLWKAVDLLTIGFELTGVVAMLRRRWMLVWLLAATCFHLTTTLILNIPFATNGICYAVFFPWGRLLRPRFCSERRRVLALVGGFVLAAGLLVAHHTWHAPTAVALITACLFWMGLGAVILRTLVLERRPERCSSRRDTARRSPGSDDVSPGRIY